VTREQALVIKSGQILLYSIYYVILLFSQLSPFMRFVAATGMVQLILFALVTQTRSSVVLVGLLLALALVINRRQREASESGRRRRLWINALIAVGIFLVIQTTSDVWTRSFVETRSRFELSSGSASITENVRWDEVEALFQQLELPELILGRGIQGVYNSPLGMNYYVHIGYFYALLKGGLFLLFLILFGIVGIGLRVLLTSRDNVILLAAGMCSWFGIRLAVGNILYAPNPTYYLVLVCLGLCLSSLTADSTIMFPLSRNKIMAVN
jgi:hypothetical protein